MATILGVASEVASNVPANLVAFDQMNHINSYERDGKQQTFISLHVAQRLVVLDLQYEAAGYSTDGWLGTAGITCSLFKVLNPFIIDLCKFLQVTEYSSEYVTEGLAGYIGCLTIIGEPLVHGLFIVMKALADPAEQIFTQFNQISDEILNYATPILNVVCLISYVAMIALGSPIAGTVGLFGMALSQVKQNGYLPACLDEALIPLCLLSGLYVNLLAEQGPIFKTLIVVASLLALLNYVAQNEKLKDYLPSFMSDMSPGKHVIDQSRSLETHISNHDSVMSTGSYNLKLNYSSLHAKELKDIIPADQLQKLNALDPANLYESIEAKCERENVDIVPQSGWNRLKDAMISGTCADERPINFDKTCLLLKAVLKRLCSPEQDVDDFRQTILELAKLGDSCNEGWNRDIGFLLQPRSNDVSWAVHHVLACLRANLINEVMRDLPRSLPQLSDEMKNLEIVGGVNNIHLLNQVQAAVWHKWRPYGGEVYLQTRGIGLFVKWMQQQPLEIKSEDDIMSPFKSLWGVLNEGLISASMIELPIPVPPHVIGMTVNAAMGKKYKSDLLVSHIEDAIAFKRIHWGVIQSWLGSLDSRGLKGILDNQTGDFNSGLVGGTRDNYFLKEAGVRLLLWDLGVLQKVDN